jgi:hypothetical protein
MDAANLLAYQIALLGKGKVLVREHDISDTTAPAGDEAHPDKATADKATAGTSGAIECAARDLVEFVYRAMNNLNSVSSALLRVNAIFVAVIGVLYAGAKDELQGAQSYVWPMSLIIATLALSMMFALYVISYEWRYLGFVEKHGADYRFAPEIKALFASLVRRTRAYQVAWWLNVAAVLLGLYVLLYAFWFKAPFEWLAMLGLVAITAMGLAVGAVALRHQHQT